MTDQAFQPFRQPRKTFNEMITIAKQDTNWLTEKAHSKLFGEAIHRGGREEVEIRRTRIITVLEGTEKLLVSHRQELDRLGGVLESMRTDVLNAVTGLRDFLQVIQDMPMSDETRKVVATQLDTVNAALTRPPVASPVINEDHNKS